MVSCTVTTAMPNETLPSRELLPLWAVPSSMITSAPDTVTTMPVTWAQPGR